jgi:hypothetical protein
VLVVDLLAALLEEAAERRPCRDDRDGSPPTSGRAARPAAETFVLEPGGQVQLSLGVLADGLVDQLDRLPQSIDDLAQARDAGSGWHDPLPTLYSALAI